MWGASPRLGNPICARSGSVLPEILTEQLLSKLSQLGQFGLAPADRPLLKPLGDKSWSAAGEHARGAAGGNH